MRRLKSDVSPGLCSSEEDEDSVGGTSPVHATGDFQPSASSENHRSLLERQGGVDGGSASEATTVSQLKTSLSDSGMACADDDNDQGEGVFEIRDFTAVSSFERLAHQASLAAKKWGKMLRATPSHADDGNQVMREEFEHKGFMYELIFHLTSQDPKPSNSTGVARVHGDATCASVAGASGVGGPAMERLGLHTFPPRAHRLQRWFGTGHFVTLSVQDQNIDVDSARTLLSAMSMGAQSVSPPFETPLCSFVPVDSGRRRRYIGEQVSGGWRAACSTDMRTHVEPSLEHLAGLQEFFWQKMGVDPEDPNVTLTIAARFTYSAEHFDALPSEGMNHEMGTAVELGFPQGCTQAVASQEAAPSSGATYGEGSPKAYTEAPVDPVQSVHLHCIWPCFPRGSFVDNAVYSELDPCSAPYWRVRIFRAEDSTTPRTQRLRNLLEFRKEAQTVRSAEHSMQPLIPKTAFESLSCVMQESLESILLPSAGEMHAMTTECLNLPVTAHASGFATSRGLLAELAVLRGVPRGTRLARLVELCADMKCFKGSVMLWCKVIVDMRKHWDELKLHPAGSASPETQRAPNLGARTEYFGFAACLAQQKFEMLQRSIEARREGLMHTKAAPTPTGLFVVEPGTGAKKEILTPRLLLPALMTEDMVIQRDMVAASITDPEERAELNIREIRSDMSSFKATNPLASFDDFMAWREKVEGLSSGSLPLDWLRRVWGNVPAQAAADQQSLLFEPEREAEMALHYLENIEGTQLLLQLFRALLCLTIEDLGSDAGIPHLRALRDRAVAAARAAFAPMGSEGGKALGADGVAAVVGEAAEFPKDEVVQGIVSAVQALEEARKLAHSLRCKFPGASGESLVQELLGEGEATVASSGQRRLVENLLSRSRAICQQQGREVFDGKGFLETLPFSKEFVLLLSPVTGRSADSYGATSGHRDVFLHGPMRMYAEIREHHLRLALARNTRLA